MLNKLSNFLKSASETGLHLPSVYDNDKKSGSFTLLFAYVSFCVSICAVIYLSIQNPTAGTTSALILWTMATVFYLMRRLTKFKADLKSDSVELDDDADESQPKKEE